MTRLKVGRSLVDQSGNQDSYLLSKTYYLFGVPVTLNMPITTMAMNRSIERYFPTLFSVCIQTSLYHSPKLSLNKLSNSPSMVRHAHHDACLSLSNILPRPQRAGTSSDSMSRLGSTTARATILANSSCRLKSNSR